MKEMSNRLRAIEKKVQAHQTLSPVEALLWMVLHVSKHLQQRALGNPSSFVFPLLRSVAAPHELHSVESILDEEEPEWRQWFQNMEEENLPLPYGHELSFADGFVPLVTVKELPTVLLYGYHFANPVPLAMWPEQRLDVNGRHLLIPDTHGCLQTIFPPLYGLNFIRLPQHFSLDLDALLTQGVTFEERYQNACALFQEIETGTNVGVLDLIGDVFGDRDRFSHDGIMLAFLAQLSSLKRLGNFVCGNHDVEGLIGFLSLLMLEHGPSLSLDAQFVELTRLQIGSEFVCTATNFLRGYPSLSENSKKQIWQHLRTVLPHMVLGFVRNGVAVTHASVTKEDLRAVALRCAPQTPGIEKFSTIALLEIINQAFQEMLAPILNPKTSSTEVIQACRRVIAFFRLPEVFLLTWRDPSLEGTRGRLKRLESLYLDLMLAGKTPLTNEKDIHLHVVGHTLARDVFWDSIAGGARRLGLDSPAAKPNQGQGGRIEGTRFVLVY